jgi:electron transport complex protein RnfD
MENLIISTSPHFNGKTTTQTIMRDVLIALAPAGIASVVLFGIKALIMICVCVATAVLSEFLFNVITKHKQTVSDLSAAVTGLLLALNLSTKVSIWHCIVGSAFAIIVVKCFFGGIGCNFANPAITARIFLIIAFGKVAGGAATNFASPELVASATPLEVIKSGEGVLPSLTDMLIGNRGGAIGETCVIALLIGFIYLLIRRVISWETPVIFVGTVFVLSLIIKQDITVALYQTLGGGLMLGAIFMATDYVTTPANKGGRVVFALGCAIITVLIRMWGYYPEGVSFSILFMNILSPYIEKWCTPTPFGAIKAGGAKK